MKLTLGFSPCPNDTFIFDALVNGRIDCDGLEFEPVICDVEELNNMALQSKLDITKLSYHAYLYVSENYQILNAGSALGENTGPLFISKNPVDLEKTEHLKVAIPGKYTTANFLLSVAFPQITDKPEMIFSAIEDAVADGSVDAGIIIHESRFTYERKGLKKIADLGESWYSCTELPIPLGGIAVNRRIDPEMRRMIDKMIHQSLLFAYENPQASHDFIRKHAQISETQIINQHISQYVNKYSLSLGNSGKNAIFRMFEFAKESALITEIPNDLFV